MPPSILKKNKPVGLPRTKEPPCSAAERKWCELVLKDGDELAAFRVAFPEYAPDDLKKTKARVKHLKNTNRIKHEMAALRAVVQRDVGYTVADVAHELLAIWQADPNELASIRVGNCRYCNGLGFEYQWGDREYAEAVRTAEAAQAALRGKRGLTEADVQAQAPMPETPGGFGYEGHAPPHPDCPECGGEGVPRVVAKDTVNLTKDGARLFAGIKMTKYGPEVQTHNRMDALLQFGRIIGAFEDRVRVRSENVTTSTNINFETTDPNVAAQSYKELMAQRG